MILLVPVPVVVVPPGFLVRVQVPVDGSPLKFTLPVARLQVGWVMAPTIGAVGVTGGVLITASAEIRGAAIRVGDCPGIASCSKSGYVERCA